MKKINYPEYTDQHYLEVKKDRHLIFDESYPYIDHSFSFKFKRFWVRLLLNLIIFPSTFFKMGLKIKGRKYLKQNKKILNSGVVSISNHIHMWDYIAINKAVRHFKPYVLVWNKNINGESGPLVRLVGGIPIPENNIKASIKYMETINNLLNSGGWLHIYPEGSMWEYYDLIRPFKLGAAKLAIKNDKPILPLAFSFKPASKLRKALLKQDYVYTLNIGQLIYPRENENERELTRRMHQAVSELAGNINNPYPPIFNKSKKL